MHGIDLPKTELEDRDDDGKWKANLIKINDEIKEIIHRIGDQPLPYDPISKWGVKFFQGIDTMLSPYTFSKTSMVQLVKFSDTFLEKIGFDNFIQTLNATDEFRKTIESFEKESLGFENSLTI